MTGNWSVALEMCGVELLHETVRVLLLLSIFLHPVSSSTGYTVGINDYLNELMNTNPRKSLT